MWMSLAQNISFDYNSKEIECDDWSVCSMKTSTSVPSGQLSALTKTAYASTHEATTSVRSCAAQMASRRPQQQVARTGESTSHLRFFFCDYTVFIIRCWPFFWWSDFRIECFRVVTNIVEILILTRLTAFQQKLKHNMHYIFLKMLNYVFSTTEICKNI